MGLLVELVLRGIIARFFGLHTRYFFFKWFMTERSYKSLSGKEVNGDWDYSQDLLNAIVGLISFATIASTILYLVYKVCPSCI